MILEPSNMERVATGPGGLFYGVYPALVTNVVDPDKQGRVRVRLPWSPDAGNSGYEAWARVATMMGGSKRGTWFIPDKDDEVLVAFEAGNPRHPYIVGALWNGKDDPPEAMDRAGNNYLKTILSRKGVRITLDDSEGAVQLRLETPGGQSIVLSDADNSIIIEDSNGNSLKLDTAGITVTATAQVNIQASTAEIDAGSVTIKATHSEFSGFVQCSTLNANSVISTSYTPGAGNVW